MFFYAKRIIYLSLYEAGEKIASAGFVGLKGEKGEFCITVQLKNIYGEKERDFPVCLLINGQEKAVGEVALKEGTGKYERKFFCRGEKVVIENSEIIPEEIGAVIIRLSENRIVRGELQQKKSRQKGAGAETETASLPLQMAQAASLPLPEMKGLSLPLPETEAFSPPADKWEQLKRQYKRLHPFGDEREFISIEPRDFIILKESFHKLVNNSFLLHGFYNYRHLILGKDYHMESDRKTDFYLGVPGVFFEREKMVAIMFGFEGFEADGQIEAGKFGYYLRRVEI